MIQQLSLIRSVGQFDSVQSIPATGFRRLTLVYAENSRGKTTLCAIFRSLASGESLPITERSRIGAQHPPHVVIDLTDPPSPVVFQNSSWNVTRPEVCVFDDVFVDQNVYSGLDVGATHRQNLHELIIGSEGVALARTMDQLASAITAINSDMRTKSNAVPLDARNGLSVDDFCALQNRPDIDDAILATLRRSEAVSRAGEVRNTPPFDPLSLPDLDLSIINSLLKKTVLELNTAALDRIKKHFARVGERSEEWIAEGIDWIQPENSQCPFCAQELSRSEIFPHYRAYFSESYSHLKLEIDSTINSFSNSLGGDGLTRFLRNVQSQLDRHRFWSTLINLPPFDLDVDDLSTVWQEARDAVLSALLAKRASPLQEASLDSNALQKCSSYTQLQVSVSNLSNALVGYNSRISTIKAETAASDIASIATELSRLKATKARHSLAVATLCDAYQHAKAAKAAKEAEKTRVRQQLDQHRSTVFPVYQASINDYLRKFNAGFSIQDVVPANPGGRPSSTYRLVINNTPINLSATGVAPSFKNTLSSGDRNSLALAFFLATLDHNPNLANTVVVIDDPVSSLDEHREFTTVQEIRRLVQRTAQVIVLSHDRSFLCRVWQHADQSNTGTLEVKRATVGSSLGSWNPSDYATEEYDRRHALLREYSVSNVGNQGDVAQSIRPVLERFLRVARPEYFTPETLLGQFKEIVRQKIGTPIEILSQADYDELSELLEYANKFHHDTNPAWERETINDGELQTFVRRTLEFVLKR
jgi:wobble nucleotide-excising tRNase